MGEDTNEVTAINETMMEPVPCYPCHSYDHHVTRCPSWLVEEDIYEDQADYVERHIPTSSLNNITHENNHRF